MSAKIILSSALAMALVSVLPVRAQPPALSTSPERVEEQPLPSPSVLGPQQGGQTGIIYPMLQNGETAPGMPNGLSDWITYNRNGCCSGPMGNYHPMKPELFIRSGFAVPTSATTLGSLLGLGWDVTGGGRLLFFNTAGDRAWNVEISISNDNYHGNANSLTHGFPMTVFDGTTQIDLGTKKPANPGDALVVGPAATVRSLNLTFVNFGLGREWYLLGSAFSPGRNWRIGVDGGGRWGSAKMEYREYKHRTDTPLGVYAAVHSDFEIPCGCCTFIAGVRGQWEYLWMHRILQTDSPLMSVTALLTMGVRF